MQLNKATDKNIHGHTWIVSSCKIVRPSLSASDQTDIRFSFIKFAVFTDTSSRWISIRFLPLACNILITLCNSLCSSTVLWRQTKNHWIFRPNILSFFYFLFSLRILLFPENLVNINCHFFLSFIIFLFS